MSIEISRRSFVGASALALVAMAPLTGCSSGGSGYSSSASSAGEPPSASVAQEEITVENDEWERVEDGVKDGECWLRCKGTVTNNSDQDIGKYDIQMNYLLRYKDKYGEEVEEQHYFRAGDVIPASVIEGGFVEQFAESRYGYPGYETWHDAFMDLRAHESIDFDFIVDVPDYVLEKGTDMEFLDPSFEGIVISYGPAVIDYGDYAKNPQTVDCLHDFDVDVSGGPSVADATFSVTNNTGKYIDKGRLYVSYYNPGDSSGLGRGYGRIYESFDLMKPGDTVELTFDNVNENYTLVRAQCVRYHIDESK